ncbi:MAG: hypothetical protein HJJLKODD_02389 [Phycisphaerae bacterium]|nr:hypothetical protein [Phycisphaerae bacterium]
MSSLHLMMIIGALLVTQPAPATPSKEQTPPSQTTTPETANEADATVRWGEVTGENVYVRSGPSTNYYPVTKVSSGVRVRVYETLHDWVAIEPPTGCYSLVSKEYVDPSNDGEGVINADRVWVRVGSDLSGGPYYAKQTQLRKGQSVTLQGELGDYYRIPPPAGSRLWISEQFIRLLPAGTENTTPAAVTTTQPGEQPDSADETAAQTLPPAPSTTHITKTDLREQIKVIEGELKTEFEKPIESRDLKKLIERFGPLTTQEDDREAKLYAEKRIEQLQRVEARMEMILKIRELNRKMETERQQFQKERSQLQPPPIPLEREFAVRGKLVKSYAYTNPVAGRQRYRLLDINSGDEHTLAYVEIPPDSTIQVDNFLGRYVGVRATGQVLLEGSVDPVVVYTAAELVILEQPISNQTTPVN